jgi:hypothetical protein
VSRDDVRDRFGREIEDFLVPCTEGKRLYGIEWNGRIESCCWWVEWMDECEGLVPE